MGSKGPACLATQCEHGRCLVGWHHFQSSLPEVIIEGEGGREPQNSPKHDERCVGVAERHAREFVEDAPDLCFIQRCEVMDGDRTALQTPRVHCLATAKPCRARSTVYISPSTMAVVSTEDGESCCEAASALVELIPWHKQGERSTRIEQALHYRSSAPYRYESCRVERSVSVSSSKKANHFKERVRVVVAFCARRRLIEEFA